MTFNIKGLDELQREVKELQRNAQKLSGKKEIPFSELFSSSFMRKYTQFTSFDELMSASGFPYETKEEFEAIPDDLFDEHISKFTKFSSWEEMQEKAIGEYVSKQLGI